ncbi:hypothetical protein [Aurantiacibacter odishensis]|uniref:hypothetical protein n=1 Tax=Aurantiacibacter odishensis TaxID=1155476 RepID=UPI0013C45895|nr:hypothetical protein [Aurantiacibacter odishensis]
MTVSTHNFQGLSGNWYPFEMRHLPTAANDDCGVYLFGRLRSDALYDVLYIGRANQLSSRVTPHHEKVRPAIDLGMTTLGQLVCANDSHADFIERDLIANFNPPLNDRLRTA